MRYSGMLKWAAAGVLTLAMMAPGTLRAQSGDTVLKQAEIQKLLPAAVFYRGQTAPTEVRNSGGVKLSDGFYIVAALVDTSGYTTGVQAKYQAYFITEVPIKFGGQALAAGAYGLGLVDGKFLITDLGAHDVLSVSASDDAGMQRPRPLEIVADPAGGFRLYIQRKYLIISR